VSRKYLQTYLDEYTWRCNHRLSPEPMFTSLLKEISQPVELLRASGGNGTIRG
jgi:hypothetical protein